MKIHVFNALAVTGLYLLIGILAVPFSYVEVWIYQEILYPDNTGPFIFTIGQIILMVWSSPWFFIMPYLPELPGREINTILDMYLSFAIPAAINATLIFMAVFIFNNRKVILGKKQ